MVMALKMTSTFNPVVLTIPKCKKVKLLKLMQNLYRSTWGQVIICPDISSKDEQVSMRPASINIKIRKWRVVES
jgi:hypothetical protein